MLTPIRLTQQFYLPDGTFPQPDSWVAFTPTAERTDTATYRRVPASTVTAHLDATGHLLNPADGTPGIVLYANDDPTTLPVGSGYRVEEHLTRQAERSYYITLPAAAPGGTITLAELVPALTAPPLGYGLTQVTVPAPLAETLAAGVAVVTWDLTGKSVGDTLTIQALAPDVVGFAAPGAPLVASTQIADFTCAEIPAAIYFCDTDTAAASFTATLPAPTAGRLVIVVQQGTDDNNTVTITPSGGALINGQVAAGVSLPFPLLPCYADGTNWRTGGLTVTDGVTTVAGVAVVNVDRLSDYGNGQVAIQAVPSVYGAPGLPDVAGGAAGDADAHGYTPGDHQHDLSAAYLATAANLSDVPDPAAARATLGAAAAADLTAEASARASADSTLTSAVSAEAATRAGADATLTSAVSAEATSRAAGDSTNATAVTAEASTARAAESANAAAITAEAATARAAESTLTTNVATNTSAIATNTAGLAAELLARAGADTLLGRRTSTAFPRSIPLISGQEDESPVATSCTITADTTLFKLGARGWLLTMAGAVTAQFRIDPPGTDDPLSLPPCQAVGLWIYLTDATKITSVGVDLFSDSGATVSWSRSSTNLTAALVTGWNMLRWGGMDGSALGVGPLVYRVRVLVVTNAATTATIGHCWAEAPAKGRILIINDGGYETFRTLAYPALKSRGLPVTFALDPAALSTGSGAAARFSEAAVATFAADGNGNEIGFHGYDGAVTSSMTAAQIRTDTLQAIKWLKRRNYYDGALWRAAWVQNAATNASAAQGLVLAYATPTSNAALEAWPVRNRWNINRYALHGRTTADLDSIFASLQLTHGLLVAYLHGVDDSGGNYITTTLWAYLLTKLDAGIAGGWLEGATFSQLWAETGGKVRQTFGDSVVEYWDETGTRVQTRLP